MAGRSSGVDLNAIPISAISRVEVLRDGASAQYGSDAIAGVVNIILKIPAKVGLSVRAVVEPREAMAVNLSWMRQVGSLLLTIAAH